MRRYREATVRQLKKELLYAPEEVRRRYVERGERLMTDVKPDRDYTYEYLFYRLTGFRPTHNGHPHLPGRNLQRDLRVLLSDLNESVVFDARSSDEPILTIRDLTARFNVSHKTIARWRQEGLLNRRYLFPGGRVKVGFPQGHVEAFVEANGDRVARGARFTRVAADERREIIRRATRMASIAPGHFSAIARRIARKLGRAAETVRCTILQHDRQHPEDRIFPDRSAPLTARDRAVIYQASLRRLPIDVLARRFRRSRSTIYRVVKETRAREILQEKTEYMDNVFFRRPEAERAILDQPLEELLPRHKGDQQPKVPADLPPYLQGLYRLPLLTKPQEFGLFRRYNYLKFRVAELKAGLTPATARTDRLEQINAFQRQALTIKNVLIQSNLRLVVSIAKRRVGRMMNFFELVSDGNVSLMRAVERFDFAKGNKFSTYASWAIIKNYARTIPTEIYQLDRYVTGRDEILDTASDRRRQPAEPDQETETPSATRELIGKVLKQLSERECQVIVSRFGLADGIGPLKLEDVGREMGVTKERIRQIEARALDKLRGMMDPDTLQLVVS